MFFTLSARLVIGSDDERDADYVRPGNAKTSRATRASKATPKKVASGVITAAFLNL